jgi:hypothetical protein
MKLTKETLKEMINEVLREDSMILSEATFGSVKRRIEPEGGSPERTAKEFVVMSSDRGERSPAENKRQYQEFKQKVKDAGFPFTEFVGSWEETDEETGEKRRVQENSVIIYSDERPDVSVSEREELFELGKKLSDEYSQEAFIYGELVDSKGGPSRIIKAFDAAGNVQDWGGPWSSVEAVKKDAPFWSRVRGGGAPFQFKEELTESEEVVEVEAPNSVIEAMKRASEHPGKKIKFVRRSK